MAQDEGLGSGTSIVPFFCSHRMVNASCQDMEKNFET